ncbi:uncharacterized protein LOC115922479 [Strongylocentrotus purpuratus]|uniref:Elicitin n=1 Tax=Strongylocentrotus purpuratus TaxID=7668 RepID=A0A7M7NNG5_STRPU|nr:uncharacterized protein LOC115922479 [Strongylocentrotus purpuratus]
MENQRGQSLGDVITLGLFLSVLIAGANGSCSLVSIATTGHTCSIKTFNKCTSNVRGSVEVTSATVSVASGSSVDATEAANNIVQCSEKACTELALFLLDHYSRQFCLTLDTRISLHGLNAAITVSYSD